MLVHYMAQSMNVALSFSHFLTFFFPQRATLVLFDSRLLRSETENHERRGRGGVHRPALGLLYQRNIFQSRQGMMIMRPSAFVSVSR